VLRVTGPAATSGFSLLRSPDDFLGNIDSMDTTDGKNLFFAIASQFFGEFSFMVCMHSMSVVNFELVSDLVLLKGPWPRSNSHI